MRYWVESILDDLDIQHLKTLYKTLDGNDYFRYRRLFNVITKPLGQHSAEQDPVVAKIKKALGTSKPANAYFVKYKEGGFGEFHTDKTQYTVVTLLEDEGLVGGNPIVIEPYIPLPRGENQIYSVKSPERQTLERDINREIVPVVVPLKAGDSLVYQDKIRHGVGKILAGERLVFVTIINY